MVYRHDFTNHCCQDGNKATEATKEAKGWTIFRVPNEKFRLHGNRFQCSVCTFHYIFIAVINKFHLLSHNLNLQLTIFNGFLLFLTVMFFSIRNRKRRVKYMAFCLGLGLIASVSVEHYPFFFSPNWNQIEVHIVEYNV